MSTFVERMIGAAKLDVRTYEEVEADTTATGHAMAVVILSSIAAGIGTGITVSFRLFVANLVAAVILWFFWAGITYLIGARLLPEPQTEADWGQLLRTTGFAASPGVFRVLGVIPGLSWIILALVGIWMLVAFVIAVRQALDYTSTLRALGVCVIGWVIYLVLSGLVGAVFYQI